MNVRLSLNINLLPHNSPQRIKWHDPRRPLQWSQRFKNMIRGTKNENIISSLIKLESSTCILELKCVEETILQCLDPSEKRDLLSHPPLFLSLSILPSTHSSQLLGVCQQRDFEVQLRWPPHHSGVVGG